VQSVAGGQPRAFNWVTDPTNPIASQVRFQPVFGGQPFTTKQFQDITYSFRSSSAGRSITPAWNGSLNATACPLRSGFPNECRVTTGVPRRAAIAQTIAPGFDAAAVNPSISFLGFCMRYVESTEQRVRR
jgi:hypothetical protein